MAENLQPVSTPDQQPRSAGSGFFDFADVLMLLRKFGCWCRTNPIHAVLLAGLFGVVGYYYFCLKAFQGMSQTPAQWIAAGWNSENDQQHCWGILPVAFILVLLRWREIAAAPKQPASSGLWFAGLGVGFFVAGIRCSEARYTIFALPLLAYGATRFLYGRQTARLIAFPCIFLLFMTPMGGVVQGTVHLQLATAQAIRVLSSIFGIPIIVDGSSIISANGLFEPMEVVGGCSGVRSLMAMTTLSALYAYFTSRGAVRGVILFGSSLLFAVLGNFARVFSVVLFARFLDARTATGLYHDYSGFVFFAVAVLAMIGVGSLLNRDWKALVRSPADGNPAPADSPKPAQKAGPLPYDY